MRPTMSLDEIQGFGLAGDEARDLLQKIQAIPESDSPSDTWRMLTQTVLTPETPYPIHNYLYKKVFEGWDLAQGPPPAWIPTAAEIDSSNITAFCERAGVNPIDGLHRWSAENRESFWQHMVDILGIRFMNKSSGVVDLSAGVKEPRWFPGARMNIAESCFLAPENETAIVYQREGGAIEEMTYGELDKLSNRVANSLVATGLVPGDSIAIAMPMTVEAVAAYLGIVKAGCAVVSIADSFAAEEIATRLRIAGAKAAVTQDVVSRAGKSLPMYEKVAHAGPQKTIVIPLTDNISGDSSVPLREGDVTWSEFLVDNDTFDPVPCDPDGDTNILFSSGTTGDPKAIPWTHTTPIKCAMDANLHHDIHPGDVVAWPTNIGWMMGPWLIYASLVNRAKMALYYGAPVTSEFCEFVQNAKVQMLGVVPSLVKAWQNSGAVAGLDWTSIKAFSSTGECSNSDDYLYLMSLARYRPIIEYCGGTEIGGGYISGTIVQPASPSTFSSVSYGLDFVILDEDGTPTPNGELYIIPPSIGLSNTLLNRDHNDVYFTDTPRGPNGELLRRHGDETEELPGGYYRGHGRADDTMNIGGIKVSSTEIERTLASVDGVLETAAIAFNPPQGGPSRLIVYAVPEAGASLDPEPTKKTMQRAIAKGLNPLFKIHDVLVVESLPRTASNKVMRRVLRNRYTETL